MTASQSNGFRLHVAGSGERKVGWLELFYDLIYVATIIQLGNLLVANATLPGAATFVALFVPVWWTWTGMMFFFNRFVGDDALHRLMVLAQMFAIAAMAMTVERAFSGGAGAFALSYAAARLLLVLFYARAWSVAPQARPLIGRYLGGFSLSVVLWALSGFLPAPWTYVAWVVGLLLEVYVSTSARSRALQRTLPPDPEHLDERYGLLTIIVLGESFIKVVGALSEKAITRDAWLLAASGFAVAGMLWWTYFDRAHHGVLRRLTFAPYLWIYGHLPLMIGITATGVGIKKLVTLHLDEPIYEPARWTLSLALAAVLLVLAAWEWIRVHEGARTSLVRWGLLLAAVVMLALGVLGAALSTQLFTVAMLVSLAVPLILVETSGDGTHGDTHA